MKKRRYAFIEACAYYIRLKGAHGDLDRLVMTTELAELITERYKVANLHWAIGGFKRYEQLLNDGMRETRKIIITDFDIVMRLSSLIVALHSIVVPDFDGETLEASMVLQYNFRSMVAAMVRTKELLWKRVQLKLKLNDRPTAATQQTENPMPVVQPAVASARSLTTATTPTTPETVAQTATTPTVPVTSPTVTPHDFLKGDYFFRVLEHLIIMCLRLIINIDRMLNAENVLKVNV